MGTGRVGCRAFQGWHTCAKNLLCAVSCSYSQGSGMFCGQKYPPKSTALGDSLNRFLRQFSHSKGVVRSPFSMDGDKHFPPLNSAACLMSSMLSSCAGLLSSYPWLSVIGFFEGFWSSKFSHSDSFCHFSLEPNAALMRSWLFVLI